MGVKILEYAISNLNGASVLKEEKGKLGDKNYKEIYDGLTDKIKDLMHMGDMLRKNTSDPDGKAHGEKMLKVAGDIGRALRGLDNELRNSGFFREDESCDMEECDMMDIEEDVNTDKLREFTDTDFYMYDAFTLPDGSDPLIFTGDEFDVIVSGTEDTDEIAVDVAYIDEDSDKEYYWSKNFKNKEDAIKAANKAAEYDSMDANSIISKLNTMFRN